MPLSSESRATLVALWGIAKEAGDQSVPKAIQEALDLIDCSEGDPGWYSSPVVEKPWKDDDHGCIVLESSPEDGPHGS